LADFACVRRLASVLASVPVPVPVPALALAPAPAPAPAFELAFPLALASRPRGVECTGAAESDGDECLDDESDGDESDGDESDGDESDGDECLDDECAGFERGGFERVDDERPDGGSRPSVRRVSPACAPRSSCAAWLSCAPLRTLGPVAAARRLAWPLREPSPRSGARVAPLALVVFFVLVMRFVEAGFSASSPKSRARGSRRSRSPAVAGV
jgi:hypothetical protein